VVDASTQALPDLHDGIPTLAALDDLMATPFWSEVKAYSDAFRDRHAQALRPYGRHWGTDAMHLWSRRWEYPFALAAVLKHATTTGRNDLTLGDVGSGVTFLPYLICDRLAKTRVACCDPNPRYEAALARLAEAEGHDRAWFRRASLQSLPFDRGELDVLLCVSVLEHTGEYGRCVEQMAEAVRPGGRLVLTFDLSLAGPFELHRTSAHEVLDRLGERFVLDVATRKAEVDAVLADDAGRLSTREVRQVSPEHLPWRYPKLQAIYDFVRGYGWTGGFRAAAVICLDLERRG
jgi:SAM-dependent methyltransferase